MPHSQAQEERYLHQVYMLSQALEVVEDHIVVLQVFQVVMDLQALVGDY